jgi:5'-nucleotidase
MKWVHTNYDFMGLEDLGERTLIVEKGGRRIGILGLYNPSILLNPEMKDRVVVDDIVGSARRGVEELKSSGAEVIVVLSHLSYRGDRALAEEVEGIDLIISGHGGKSLIDAERAGPGTWIVAPGSLGRYLGRAELDLSGSAEPGVQEIRGDLIVMVPSLPNDPRLDPLFERYEEERRELTEREFEARRQSLSPTTGRQDPPEADPPTEP